MLKLTQREKVVGVGHLGRARGLDAREDAKHLTVLP